ncbi:hypothetical protein ABFS82_04G151400 [Erythranthe guttata]
MAHGAVGSLKLTIERLKNSSYISIVQNSSPKIIKLLYKEVCSFQDALEEFDERRNTINMKMVKILEAEIMDVVYQFEDVIESYVLDQIHSQSEESHHGDQIHPPSMLFSVDLQELKQDVDSFIKTVKKMKRAYIHELRNPSPEEEEEDDDVVTSRINFGGNHEPMIGFSEHFIELRDLFTNNYEDPSRMIFSLDGMAGIGKTTLATKLFQDPSIVSCYTRRAFVTIGPKYLLKNVLLHILVQLNPSLEISDVDGETLAMLERMVRNSLKHQRYFIVLDDIWDEKLCSALKKLFPDDDNRSLVLMTTRIGDATDIAHDCRYDLPLLDKKDSWVLLRQKVFGQEACSYELEKAGKKIAENCEGLPLTIVTVANILSKSEKTTEYWNKVSDEKDSIYYDAYDQMSKVLLPSYNYLDQRLKACFLYMGIYPQRYKILFIELFGLHSLWNAEGIVYSAEQFREKVSQLKMVEMFDLDPCSYYILELSLKNLIIHDGEKSCYSLHSSFWYMCNKEAVKNKFFYAFNCSAGALPEEDLIYQRRLCMQNNVLLAIQDVQDSITSASMVRSLLCTGNFHEYPVPLCLEKLRLLRVVHAVTIRFYEFPMEVLKLVQLRYLSLTFNGNIPSSISKLWNLQWLIIGQKLIVENKSSCNMPMEIWDMKELKKLDVGGKKLSDPREGSFLPNLLGLHGLHHQSCTKDVFGKIPNLMELSIVISSSHDNGDQPLSCFDHVSHLHKLQSLACIIQNPTFEAEVVAPLAPLSYLPSSLTKLYLSGLGYPWEEMSKISSLPNLTHLYLKFYAFRGRKWEVRDDEFQRLVYLEIEDSDLVQWTFQNDRCIPNIRVLRILHCYKLKEMPLMFGASLIAVSVVDCSPMAVNCANKLQQDWDDKYEKDKGSVEFYVHSSWDDGSISHDSPY